MSAVAVAQSFSELGVCAPLVAALQGQGITEPFPIQALTISDGLAGRDICGKAKTGSGKTLAFGLPLLQRLAEHKSGSDGSLRGRRPRALVLVPTRELCRQVADVLAPLAEAVGQELVACYGGVPMEEQIAQLRSGTDVVVATPGRLIDLKQRGSADLAGVEIVVLDEADRMADMGFTPQVEWLLRHLVSPHQTMLFSATLDRDVDRLVRDEMNEPVMHDAEGDQRTVTAMEHRFIQVHQMDKVRVAAAICRSSVRTIVFTRTKRGADTLTSSLGRLGVDARAIHGDLRQEARERALRRFAEGKLPVLVATDVAARGLDVENIEVVLQYDPPDDHKAYLHRAGRTARAGMGGLVVTLVLWNQVFDVQRVERRLGLGQPIVEMFSNDPRLANLRAWDPKAAA